MAGRALEQALALQESPALRFALHERALPEDIDEIIQLATGTQPLLGEAASRSRLPEGQLLEAVRFYLQQALFEGGDDAYRILGVTSNASTEQIHQHFRWLQRWLHPDRGDTDWGSTYATRLNWAWSQLRGASARRQYDLERAEAQAAASQASASSPGPNAMPPAWAPADSAPPLLARYARRMALVMVAACCAGLMYLVIERKDGAGSPDEAVAPLLAEPEVGAGSAGATTRNAGADEEVSSLQHAFEAGMLAPATSIDTNASTRVDGSGLVTRTVESGPEVPAEGSSTPPSNQVADRDMVVASRRVADVTAPPMRSSKPMATETRMTSSSDIPARMRVVGGTEAVPRETERQSIAQSGAAVPASGRGTRAEADAAVGAADPARVAGRPGPSMGDTNSAAGLASGPAPPGIEPSPSLPSAVEAPGPPEPVASNDLVQRAELAKASMRDVLAFIRGTGAARPNWHDASTSQHAQEQRDALRVRTGDVPGADFSLASPRWSLSGERAVLDAGYLVIARQQITERGRMRLDMAWRDDGWSLTAVELEPQR